MQTNFVRVDKQNKLSAENCIRIVWFICIVSFYTMRLKQLTN